MKSTVGDRGQITIPKKLRDRLGIRPGQQVEFEEHEGRLVVRKLMPRNPVDGVYGILRTEHSTDELVAELRGSTPNP